MPVTIPSLSDSFDAVVVGTVSPAADQDGFEGGWVAHFGTDDQEWFETPEAAKAFLLRFQSP